MYKNRFFMKLGVFLFALFLLSGCGSNNSQGVISNSPSVPDTNTTSTIAKLSIADGDVTVSQNNEGVSIRVKALTKNDSLATEGTILAQYLEADNTGSGDLTPPAASISEGFATFTYVAPKDIQNQIDSGNNGTSFKFYSAEDTSITTMVSIDFNTTGESEGGGGNPIASLTVSNGDMILSQDAEAVTVNILATDSDGAPLQSGTIRVRYPEDAVRVGLFSTDEVTINSGIASFSYIGPDPIYYRYRSFPYVGEDDLVVFSFEYKENPTYVADWEVSFIPEVEPIEPPAPTYRIASLAANEDITVTTDGEEPTIKVLAFMSGNVPVPEGTVSVIYPPDVATKNIGTFSPAKAEIVDGIATFTYTGPTPLIADVSQTFTFRATNYPTATDTMSVNYAPQIDIDNPIANTLIIMNDSDNNISNGNTIEITKYSEVVNVKVRVYGVDNNPFDGGNVKVQYPDIILSGTDVGSFASLSVPCVNGVADFTYTAPSDLQGRTDSFEFTFSHDSEGSPATSSLEMTMNPETGQIVITTYELHMLPSDGNNTMNLESKKAFTAKVVDEDGNEIGDGDG
ncbi:MAG: hypothetical protein U9R50_05805, partial [Campylobacterota bacterium]|nr:hypothetical protein [Campylobacterota bacterium]